MPKEVEIAAGDRVNHPAHYKSKCGLEVIDVIEAFCEDLTGFEAVGTANVIKYICRWKKKNGLEDLEKARWYLDRLISRVEISATLRSSEDEQDAINKFAQNYAEGN